MPTHSKAGHFFFPLATTPGIFHIGARNNPVKRVLLITPDFTPLNVAGVMRPRFLAAHLRACGWEPVVVTVRAECYAQPGDAASLALLAPELRVERVGAWPVKLCRPLGFGDIAWRAQRALRARVAEIIAREKVDLIFCSVLPGATMLVGAWAKRKFNVPFILDYQDPWFSDWGAAQPRFSKAGLAHWLAAKLEPVAVAQADALTAVSDETLATLRQRGLLRANLPVEILPIGADENDHVVAAKVGRPLTMDYETTDARAAIVEAEKSHRPIVHRLPFSLAYLGTITERMLPAVKTLFAAVKIISAENPERYLRLHFIGTSAQPDGTDKLGLRQLAAAADITEQFVLKPRRAPYLDALRTMQAADVLLLPGSTDAHYTASKIFPCWLARRPVFGLFHEASSIVTLARELGGVRLVTYGHEGPAAHETETTDALRALVGGAANTLPTRNEAAFAPYSAARLAEKYAALFNRVTGGRA
ncbi:MAG: hypothetical protein RLZZ350_466 [Verrucomicrobiota bacterium]|jgi:glycosyltransferase involved in cell wall biosynthesis